MKPIGGRGKVASYKSTHVRIPDAIKHRVEQLKEQYFAGSLEYADELTAEDHKLANEYRKVLTGNNQTSKPENNSLTSLSDSIELAKKILKQRKSAKDSVAKLLSAIYNVEVSVEDLK